MSLSPSCACALVLLSACIDDETPGLEGLSIHAGCGDDSAATDTGTPPEDDSGGPLVPVALPGGPPYGTYSELNVAWFQWILSQPRVGNPLFDPTGADCASGQSGEVWFLAGSFNHAVVERSCTIPSGKAIFFPILNAFTSCYFGDKSCTEKDLPVDLDASLDGVSAMYATIDGDDMGDPVDYRVLATEFSASLPDGNLFQALGIPIDGLVEDLYGGGYWMLFDPLPAGKHTITFGGVFPDTWADDNTYTLTVE